MVMRLSQSQGGIGWTAITKTLETCDASNFRALPLKPKKGPPEGDPLLFTDLLSSLQDPRPA